MAVKFNGTTGNYSSTLGVPNTSGADFTILCWYYCNSVTASAQSIAYFGNSSSNPAQWFEQQGTTIDLGAITAGANVTHSQTLAVGNWYKVAYTVSGTTASLYVATATSVTVGTPATATWGDITSPVTFRIGAANQTAAEFNSGAIANFKQYSAALTATELDAELSQYVPLRTTNLVRWHPFIDPDTVDYSGNSNTLTAAGTIARHTSDPPIRWARSRSPRIGISATPISGTDSAALTEDPASISASVATTESGALTDSTPSIAVTTTASESFSFGETASISITSTRTDSGSVTEQPVSSQLVWSLTDSSALTEAHAEAVTTTAADSGTLTDSPGVVLQLNALTATDSGSFTDSSVADKTELRFVNETFTLSENAVSVQFAAQVASETFGLTETATVSVVTTANDSFALITENRTIVAVITVNQSATLNDLITQLNTSVSVNDAFGIFIEDGQVDYKDLPEWIYANIGTANTLVVDVDTANHLQSVLDAPNTIRTNISTKFWYSDIETEGLSGDTEVPATHGGDVDSKTYYAYILEP